MVGTGKSIFCERPMSRLSKRTTWKPRSASSSQNASGQPTICVARPITSSAVGSFGDPSDPTALLVMGLATQMVGWPDAFCEELAGRGFHVVRFDNRDIGRSQKMDFPVPTLRPLLLRDKKAAHYTLEDMSDDGFALLDHLGVGRAHLVGVSMGGMIAQTMAA